MVEDTSASERIAFLKLALLFQGGLILVAMAAGWCLGEPLTTRYRWSLTGIAGGTVATIPLLIFLWLVYRSRATSLVRIRELLRDTLGKTFAACHWFDLALLALMAGLSEEYLFRGILEPWFSGFGRATGLIVTNILFGLCHAATPMYALIATLLGAYLSMTLLWSEQPDLVVPVFCHALYDFVAFWVVRQSYWNQEVQVTDERTDLPATTN